MALPAWPGTGRADQRAGSACVAGYGLTAAAESRVDRPRPGLRPTPNHTTTIGETMTDDLTGTGDRSTKALDGRAGLDVQAAGYGLWAGVGHIVPSSLDAARQARTVTTAGDRIRPGAAGQRPWSSPGPFGGHGPRGRRHG
jgi:hypothetical protein